MPGVFFSDIMSEVSLVSALKCEQELAECEDCAHSGDEADEREIVGLVETESRGKGGAAIDCALCTVGKENAGATASVTSKYAVHEILQDMRNKRAGPRAKPDGQCNCMLTATLYSSGGKNLLTHSFEGLTI